MAIIQALASVLASPVTRYLPRVAAPGIVLGFLFVILLSEIVQPIGLVRLCSRRLLKQFTDKTSMFSKDK